MDLSQIKQDVEAFAQNLEADAAQAAALFKNLFTPATEQTIVTAAEDVAGVIGAIQAAQAAGSTGLVAVITAAFKYLSDRQANVVTAPEAAID